MVREIMKDEAFLALPSERATAEDMDTARDLLETLEAHKAGCVGMAANMIGVRRRIIVFDNKGSYMVMFNPEIVKKSGAYEAEEGCLSLTGTRKTAAGSRSRCSIRTRKCRYGSRPSPAGPRRSSSMRSITARGLLFELLWHKKRHTRSGVPFAYVFSPAARSYHGRRARENAGGIRSGPPVLRCWRPRGSCPCPFPLRPWR